MSRAASLYVMTLAAMLALGSSAALAVEAEDGEFGGECVMGLALGKDIKTDCSVNTVYKGKTYCFGNETAKSLFLKRPEDFLLQAHVYYNSKQESQDKQ
jgi:YHS domain-containing protein